jgi:hypothetical protein
LSYLSARSPLRTEHERDGSVMVELLPRRGALSAYVQCAVVVGGPVDGAEAAVRLGELVAGGRQGVALQRGNDAGGVFGFFALARGDFCSGLLCLFCCELDDGGALCGGFIGLLFFVFFGALFGDGLRGAFIAALVGPGKFRGA